jgi:hypothetical protein
VIARAVLPLVVHPRHPGQRLQNLGPGQDPLALVGVETNPLPLGRAEDRRLLPDPVGDGHPAKVVQQRRPPEVGDRLRAEAERGRGPFRQDGHLAGVTQHERRLEVDHVGECSSKAIQALPADRAPRLRLGLQHGFPDVPGPDLVQDARAEPGEGLGHARVEPAARPAADHLLGRLRAAEPVEDDGLVTDLGKTGREADVLGGQALRGALAVPPLERLVQAVPNPGAQTQPLGEAGADLADRSQNGLLPLASKAQGTGEVAHPIGPGSLACQYQQGEGLTTIPEVGSLGRGTGTQLVAAEVGLLVGRRGAAQVAQERGVVHVGDVRLGGAHPPRQGGGDEAGSDRLLRLLSHPQVGRHRHGSQEVGQPDPLAAHAPPRLGTRPQHASRIPRGPDR